MSDATTDQLVRAIRREEAHVAQLRSRSAARRADLLTRLAEQAGSMSEAARLLGSSPQAVSKSLARARQEADSDWYTDVSISAMDVRLGDGVTEWGASVPTVEEWQAIEDPREKHDAAVTALDAWAFRTRYTDALANLLRGIAAGCDEAAEASSEETQFASQVWEIVLGEIGDGIPTQLLPNSRADARDLADFARAIAAGLRDATSSNTYRFWEDRAGHDGETEQANVARPMG